ncbi:electron carrier [Balamuthia mandrillaris]
MWTQGARVLYLTGPVQAANVAEEIEPIQQAVGETGAVVLAEQPPPPTEASFDFVVVTSGAPHDGEAFLSQLARVLKPGGSLVLHNTDKTEQELSSALTLAGFIEKRFASDHKQVIATKPNFSIGAKASLKHKKTTSPSSSSTTSSTSSTSSNNNVWKLSGDDMLEEDLTTPSSSTSSNAVWKISVDDIAAPSSSLIDESSLLEAEDLITPSAATGVKRDDCEVGKGGKRKACKDCTCGRADEEAAGQPQPPQAQPKSSCGSCYLGDAFRCSGCPYKGLPPFKPGEKVTITL